MGRTNPYRHPLGRRCRDLMPLAIVMTLFYGLPRLAFDSWKDQRRGRS
jgi:hypothetical protein